MTKATRKPLSRTVCQTETRGTRVRLRFGDFEGTLIAVYDHYAWVVWDSSGAVKGCWQPNTHPCHDVFVLE